MTMYTNTSLRSPIVFSVAACLLLLPSSAATGEAIVSTWMPPGDNADWFATENWTDGVPGLPGDEAILPSSSTTATFPVLTAPATLGNLRFDSGGSLASISGDQVLTFDQPGDAAAQVFVAQVRRALVATLSAPIAIAPGESLNLDISNTSTLRLEGELVSSGGDITMSTGGDLVLAAASPNWSGSLLVEGGTLRMEEVNALAGSHKVRIGNGSTLAIGTPDGTAQYRGEYAVPSLVLDGGVMQAIATPSTGSSGTVVRADIDLAGDGVIKVPMGDAMEIRGTLSGVGGVRFDKYLTSSREYTEIRLTGPTSYQGPTTIGPGVRVEFQHGEMLGDTSAGTLVDRGTLVLRGEGGSEHIEVSRGAVQLSTTGSAFTHQFDLYKGRLSGGPLATTVNYTGGIILGTESGGAGPILEGGIQGTGSVYAMNAMELHGLTSIRGNLFVPNRGPVVLAGTLQSTGDVYVTESALELAGDLGNPQGRFSVAARRNTARLFVSHDNTLEAVTLDPRHSSRTGFFDRIEIDVEDGVTLTVTDELQFLGGVLRGRFAGQSVLTKKDTTSGFLEDIAGSEFERVDVELGSLTITGDAGATAPDIHLSGHYSTSVQIDTTTDYTGDIYLNSSNGPAQVMIYSDFELATATLTLGETTTLRGDIYLGEQGSSISGPYSTGAGYAALTPESSIHGGELDIRSYAVAIRGGQHTYSGATQINCRNVVLEGEGRLNSTSMILGGSRLSRIGGQAGLVLDNSTLGAHGDRIPDATPVHIDGMRLTLIGSSSESVTETLGLVSASRGMSDIVVTHPDGAPGATTLHFNALERQQGAMVQFHREGDSARIQLATPPTLDDGLLGGWSRFDGDDFATYGPNGIVAYSDLYAYETNLATATANDNVKLQHQELTLTSDKSINALRSRDTDLDLGGHRLVIESGGLINTPIQLSTIAGPGELTAGADSGGELFVSGSHRIEADIVDNGDMPVGLTHSATYDGYSAQLTLSGKNTYSGPTTLNSYARLEFTTPESLPQGGDLRLNGGYMGLAFDSAEPFRIGELVVRGAARLQTSGVSALQPTSVLIESGEVETPVAGDAPIIKTGLDEGYVLLGSHTGPIEIQQGRLTIDSDLGEASPSPDEAQPITIRKGGQLYLDRYTSPPSRKIVLDGGSIYNALGDEFSAPIEVLASGGMLQVDRGATEFTGDVTGAGTLQVDGGFGNGTMFFNADLNGFAGDLLFTGGSTFVQSANASYQGNVTISAASVNISHPQAFGSGKVTITPEGSLGLVPGATADIDLNGGVLGFSYISGTQLHGNLDVTADSRFSIPGSNDSDHPQPRIDCDLRLHNGTQLSMLGNPAGALNATYYLQEDYHEQLEIAGRVIVDGTATLESYDSFIRLTGSIEPGTAEATLQLEGNDTFSLQTSINLVESRSLSILVDGEPGLLELSGGGKNITGSGVLQADVEVSGSAGIHPGNSAGLLTIDGNVSLGNSGQLQVDLAGTSRGVSYDALDVTGDVSLDFAFLNIGLLDDFVPSPDDSFVILTADHIEGTFWNAMDTVYIGSLEMPITYTETQVILGNPRVVPEPTALAMIGILLTLAAVIRVRGFHATRP